MSPAPFSYLGTQIQSEEENLRWSEEEGSSVQAHFYIWDSVAIKLDLPCLWGLTSKDLLFRIATCGLLGPLLQLWTLKEVPMMPEVQVSIPSVRSKAGEMLAVLEEQTAHRHRWVLFYV